MTNVSCDEWISPDVFKDSLFEQSDDHPLRLYNVNLFLTETKSSMYLTKSFTGELKRQNIILCEIFNNYVAGDALIESLENNVETYMDLYDIQKKINPSKSIAHLRANIFEMTGEFISLQDTQEGLIVVASFVDRLPNLGGIARTCEIFGVKALVVANADCIKDKEFQFLSVSADKWLNILQVFEQLFLNCLFSLIFRSLRYILHIIFTFIRFIRFTQTRLWHTNNSLTSRCNSFKHV